MGYLEITLRLYLTNYPGKNIARYFWQNYSRYLDDGQIMWDSRLGNFNHVFEIMNNLNPMINFTSEMCLERLIFFDVTILKTEHSFKTEIFQRVTLWELLKQHVNLYENLTR